MTFPCRHNGHGDFAVFHDLMAFKVRDILLILSPYDAFLMEADGSLASRIINEYRGLNLSRPPRVHLAQTGTDGLAFLAGQTCDLVITTPRVEDMDGFELAARITDLYPGLAVVMIGHSHSVLDGELEPHPGATTPTVDHSRFFIWNGDPELLLAIVKNIEDHRNAVTDCSRANVRVILLVEDNPYYLSFFLPRIYKEVVRQTQAVLAEGLNQEHRLLHMRARPKILTAATYHTALDIYHRFREHIFAVIADTRFPHHNRMDDEAGLKLLRHIRRESRDMPLLLMSSETANQRRAAAVPAVFLDKNQVDRSSVLATFFQQHLGFGPFVFRFPDGTVIGQANSIIAFERTIRTLAPDSLRYHALHNHFSNWIMARGEVELARLLLAANLPTEADTEQLRRFICEAIYSTLKRRQKGVITLFQADDFDAEIMDFVRTGDGQLGGKGQGLAFLAHCLRQHNPFCDLDGIAIDIPPTFILTTSAFDAFIGSLDPADLEGEDPTIDRRFAAAALPESLRHELAILLEQVRHPLIVRSSSTTEDAHHAPYAGLYRTICLANNHADDSQRLQQLEQAVKLVYASTYHQGPQSFRNRPAQRPAMAVMIQRLIGQQRDDLFYPAVSGVLQSHNYYPVGPMLPTDGLAHLALGLGKTVVEGGRALRFSPAHPGHLPQFSTVDDILANRQTSFYALALQPQAKQQAGDHVLSTLVNLPIERAWPHLGPLFSLYSAEDHALRDHGETGQPILTFANILKYNQIPLAKALEELIAMGKGGLGSAMEMEFALDLNHTSPPILYLLQIRPMVTSCQQRPVALEPEERDAAVISSDQFLGQGIFHCDHILWVDRFALQDSRQIAREIETLNRQSDAYLLIGPGRWGSADPFLGIPVQWQAISNVTAIVELRNEQLRVEASQGTHFFQNITSLEIPYITVDTDVHRFDRHWLRRQPVLQDQPHCRLIAANMALKLNQRSGECLVLPAGTGS